MTDANLLQYVYFDNVSLNLHNLTNLQSSITQPQN